MQCFCCLSPALTSTLVTFLGGGSSGKQGRDRLLQSCLPFPFHSCSGSPWLLESPQSPGCQRSASPGSASRVCICACPGIHYRFGTKNLLAVNGKSWKGLGWDPRQGRQSGPCPGPAATRGSGMLWAHSP